MSASSMWAVLSRDSAALTAAQIAGLAFARHVVGVPRLVDASQEELVAAVGPVLEHYLTGDLSPKAP